MNEGGTGAKSPPVLLEKTYPGLYNSPSAAMDIEFNKQVAGVEVSDLFSRCLSSKLDLSLVIINHTKERPP